MARGCQRRSLRALREPDGQLRCIQSAMRAEVCPPRRGRAYSLRWEIKKPRPKRRAEWRGKRGSRHRGANLSDKFTTH